MARVSSSERWVANLVVLLMNVSTLSGAHNERPGDAWPVSVLLGRRDSPAALSCL